MAVPRIRAPLDSLNGYPVYLDGQRIGSLRLTPGRGWSATRGRPNQWWEFESGGHEVGLRLGRAMTETGSHYKAALLAEMERAAYRMGPIR